jgi:hypothetical protein
MRGISSPRLSGCGSFRRSDFSGGGWGGIEEKDDLAGETDNRFSEPCVLLLNLEGSGGCCDIVLSRRVGTVLLRSIILCRAVRSNTLFSVFGKYSVRCVVISSLGGRCPKKLRSLDGLFALCTAGLKAPDVGDGGSSAFSGSLTPRPLRILMELARLVLLLAGPTLRNLLGLPL